MADARCAVMTVDVSDVIAEDAALFMDEYWPGWYCSHYRCGHYRLAEERSPAWCWLRHGIGAEGREDECPAYKRAVRLKLKTPNELAQADAACGVSPGAICYALET